MDEIRDMVYLGRQHNLDQVFLKFTESQEIEQNKIVMTCD